MKRKSYHEEVIYNLAKDFQDKTGVNIFQAQLVDLFRKERPDLEQKYIRQYVAIYVDKLVAQGRIEKTVKNSMTNLYVK